MKKVRAATTESILPIFNLLQGQHWLLLDKRMIQVGHVGRLLAHHRIIVPWLKHGTPRRELLTSVKDLKSFLQANGAVLVQNAS